MTGDSDESARYWTPSSEQPKPEMNWWRNLVIIVNIAFGAWFILLNIQYIFHFWYSILLLPLYPLFFWLSYRNKSKEFQKSNQSGVDPELDMTHDFIALVMNVVFAIILILLMIELSTEFFAGISFWLFFIFITTSTNFETLGSSLAFIRVSRNKEMKDTSV